MAIAKIGFYIMAGQQIMDGPFDTQNDAVEFLQQMCGPYATPELLKQFLAYFDGKMLGLVKLEDGTVINGHVARSMMTATEDTTPDPYQEV
jgi:hypothetical protein